MNKKLIGGSQDQNYHVMVTNGLVMLKFIGMNNFTWFLENGQIMVWSNSVVIEGIHVTQIFRH